VKTFQNPRFALSKGAYSDTREVLNHPLSLFNQKTKKIYFLNLIDTSGLYESRSNKNEIRSNNILKGIISKFIEYNLTYIDIVIFVLDIDQTITQQDIECWKELVELIGPSYSYISLIVFSYCDRKTNKKIGRINNRT